MPFAIGDVRVAARGEQLVERIAASGSLVVRKVGVTRAGEMAVHRFLSSPYVSVSTIMETLAVRTAEASVGRRIIVIQDTSEINFKESAGLRRGFGPGANGRDPGFFIHPLLALDAESESVIGLLGARIWTREAARVSPRRSRPLIERESARWLDGCTIAAAALKDAGAVTMVSDRESDIYDLFVHRPKQLDLIVRAAQDRRLAAGGRLSAALAAAPALGRSVVRLPPRRPGEKERTAQVELRAGPVRIARPRTGKVGAHALAEHIELTLVEAREIDPPDPKSMLLWRLLTAAAVVTPEDAAAVVATYRLRWRIEQLFRALKSDGLRLDESQIAEPERMFNLAALALAAAVRTIQLVDARHGSPRPIGDVVDPALTPALQRISTALEGKTARQKNPHPPHSLAFVAWIAARLGGWNCYYKPPGPKTIRNGWSELAAMLAGYALATREADP